MLDRLVLLASTSSTLMIWMVEVRALWRAPMSRSVNGKVLVLHKTLSLLEQCTNWTCLAISSTQVSVGLFLVIISFCIDKLKYCTFRQCYNSLLWSWFCPYSKLAKILLKNRTYQRKWMSDWSLWHTKWFYWKLLMKCIIQSFKSG